MLKKTICALGLLMLFICMSAFAYTSENSYDGSKNLDKSSAKLTTAVITGTGNKANDNIYSLTPTDTNLSLLILNTNRQKTVANGGDIDTSYIETEFMLDNNISSLTVVPAFGKNLNGESGYTALKNDETGNDPYNYAYGFIDISVNGGLVIKNPVYDGNTLLDTAFISRGASKKLFDIEKDKWYKLRVTVSRENGIIINFNDENAVNIAYSPNSPMKLYGMKFFSFAPYTPSGNDYTSSVYVDNVKYKSAYIGSSDNEKRTVLNDAYYYGSVSLKQTKLDITGASYEIKLLEPAKLIKARYQRDEVLDVEISDIPVGELTYLNLDSDQRAFLWSNFDTLIPLYGVISAEYVYNDAIGETEIMYTTLNTPNTERPRVWFNRSDIPAIISNGQKTENKDVWNTAKAYAEKSLETAFGTNNADEIIKTVESKAFWSVLYDDSQKGRDAVNGLKKYLENYSSVIGTDYNSKGEAVYLIAVVYDWCNPYLTSSEKSYFQEKVISIMTNENELTWPPDNGSAVMGHAAEGILMRDNMVAAIAMYGDRNDIYQNVAGRFFAEYVDARKFFNEGGYFNPGYHYYMYRGQWEAISERIIKAAYGTEHIYGEAQKNNAYTFIYAQRPDGGILRSGDGSYNNAIPDTKQWANSLSNYRINMNMAASFGDSYLKYQQPAAASVNMSRAGQNQMITPVEYLICNDPDLAAKSNTELPLSRYMGGRAGVMIARTGWGEDIESNAVVAEMKVGKYQFNEHQHLDAGGFQIYYKGGLANDTGYYQADDYQQTADTFKGNEGNTAYGSAHDVNYNSRTIAHNCMLVYDPDEVFTKKTYSMWNGPIENDGGQNYKNNGKQPLTVAEIEANPEKWKVAEVLAHQIEADTLSPDYSYLKGDIGGAYSDKVSEYDRSFMFLNLKDTDTPAALIVFDRIKSSDASFKKTWLLHTKNKPSEISDSRYVATVTDNGYNGKLTLDILNPDSFNVNVIEGEEGDAWVNGTNYFATVRSTGVNEGGGSRIEISPANENELDYFLNVMQVGDADGPDAKSVQPIYTDTHLGVLVADRAVLFAKDRGRYEGIINLALTGEKLYKITIADCQSGKWQIVKDSVPVATVDVTAEGSILAFEGGAGEYQITKLD